MKKTILLLFILSVQTLWAQRDTVWRLGGMMTLNVTQVSLTNWAAGGQNSFAGTAMVSSFANYKHGKNSWENTASLEYGMLEQGRNVHIVKSNDKIDLSSKYGREAAKKIYYTSLFNFRSQFAPGYNYPNDSVVISRFLAPGYATLALGLDYKPSDLFSLFLSPATARLIVVNDKKLSSAKSFGVDSGKTTRFEAGAYLKAAIKEDITPDLNITSTIDFFSNYLDQPENIDVNWQLLLSLKVSKYISASLSTQLLYDDNTRLVFYKSDGFTVDHTGPGTQIKEVVGIGIAYKFAGVGVK